MALVYAQKNLTDDTTDAFDSFVEVYVTNLASVAIQLAGTFAGTVEFEATVNGSDWVALTLTPSTGGAGAANATAAGVWQGDCGGYTKVRARCSTYTSGTIDASIGASVNTVVASVSASDGQVLFMSGTDPAGDSGLTYDKTSNVLTVTGGVTSTGFAPLHQATGTLTNAEILTLPTTAVQLAGAPGSDRAIIPINGAAKFVIAVPYGNVDANAALVPHVGAEFFSVYSALLSGLLDGGADTYLSPFSNDFASSAFYVQAGIVDLPLKVSLANGALGNLTDGDAGNSLTVDFTYYVFNLVTGLFE